MNPTLPTIESDFGDKLISVGHSSYKNVLTGDDPFFPNTPIDCTGIVVPELDLLQLSTYEEEWGCVPSSRLQYLSNHASQDPMNEGLNPTHPTIPFSSEQFHDFQYQHSHESKFR